jgi:copper chaperone
MSTGTTSRWQVRGMTCAHCVASVTEELLELDGVESVDVTLATGEVLVASTIPLDPAAVSAAVEEAGYSIV